MKINLVIVFLLLNSNSFTKYCFLSLKQINDIQKVYNHALLKLPVLFHFMYKLDMFLESVSCNNRAHQFSYFLINELIQFSAVVKIMNLHTNAVISIHKHKNSHGVSYGVKKRRPTGALVV